MRKLLWLSLPVFIFSGCYPLSTGAVKWRIKWDKDMAQGKEDFVEASPAMRQGAPNIIILLADDLGRFEVSAYDGVDHISTTGLRDLTNPNFTGATLTSIM